MIKEKLHKLIHDIFHYIGLDIRYCYPRPFMKSIRKCYPGRKDLVGVEVGVCGGENALHILEYLPIKKLYLIDPYKEYEGHNIENNPIIVCTQKEVDDAENQAHRRLSKFKDKIVWIKESSNEAYKKIPKGLDFVYIDGDHKYEFVKEDMKNYYPLVKEGGVFAGHDIGAKDVLLAFAGFIKRKDFLSYTFTPDWIIIKKKND